jgi:hypothetical protein
LLYWIIYKLYLWCRPVLIKSRLLIAASKSCCCKRELRTKFGTALRKLVEKQPVLREKCRKLIYYNRSWAWKLVKLSFCLFQRNAPGHKKCRKTLIYLYLHKYAWIIQVHNTWRHKNWTKKSGDDFPKINISSKLSHKNCGLNKKQILLNSFNRV